MIHKVNFLLQMLMTLLKIEINTDCYRWNRVASNNFRWLFCRKTFTTEQLERSFWPYTLCMRNVFAGSPTNAWRLLISSFILKHIIKCTITEAHRQPQIRRLSLLLKNWKLSLLSYMRGELQKKVMYFYIISGLKDGASHCPKALCPETDSVKFLFLSFDIKSNRSQRQQTKNFVIFSEVWNLVIDNYYTSYEPQAFITFDEQFFPSKGLFSQFMASKPDKFGQKYCLAADKESKYLINGFPYIKKDKTRPVNERASDHFVMQLMRLYLSKGRNIRTHNYFTSVRLSTQ